MARTRRRLRRLCSPPNSKSASSVAWPDYSTDQGCRRKELEAQIGSEYIDEFLDNLSPMPEVETAEQTELIDFPEEPQLTAEQ